MSTTGRLDDVRFLVLDDHPNMRRLWRTILLSLGVKWVHEAGDAAEAFELLRSRPVDIAIVDQVLGDLTGIEFIRLLRGGDDSPVRHLPIIACTADTRRTVIKELIDAGADEVLAKPVSINAAWVKFHEVVMRRREFVRANQFFGPDRRRRTNGVEPENDRRRSTS